jgi:hypothetical protein
MSMSFTHFNFYLINLKVGLDLYSVFNVKPPSCSKEEMSLLPRYKKILPMLDFLKSSLTNRLFIYDIYLSRNLY